MSLPGRSAHVTPFAQMQKELLMKTMISLQVIIAVATLTSSAAFGQWSQTDFADSVGVDAIVTQGENIFVAGGGGGFVPLPVVTGPGSIHDRTASYAAESNYASIGKLSLAESVGTGVFVSSDSGATWSPAGLQGSIVFTMAVAGKYLFAADRGGRIFRTSDSGAVWDSVGSLGSGWLQSLNADSVGPGRAFIFYAAGGPIYMSTDTGTTWTELEASLPGAGGGVTCLASDGPDIFAGTWDGPGPIISSNFSSVFRSTDHGAQWTSVATIFTPDCIAAKGDLVLVGSSHGGVAVSADSGTTWSAAGQNLDFFSIRFIGNNILAGTSSGLYRSIDNGATWMPVDSADDSLPTGMLAVTSHDIFAVSGTPHTDLPRLFMGPASEIVRAPISEVTPVIEPPRNVPLGYALLQNYPNPFNPTTNIEYRISDVGFVTLKVYDVLGQRVATLVDKVEQPGSYEVQFNGSNLASGVYFYRLDAGGYSKTLRMLLLK